MYKLSSLHNTEQYVIHALAIVGLSFPRRPSANVMGGGRNILESYPFNLPSEELLLRDKKISRRSKQHEKDLRSLRDKHDKVNN